MQVLPQALLEKIPQYDEVKDEKNPVLHCRLYVPGTHYSWYIVARSTTDAGWFHTWGEADGPPGKDYISLGLLENHFRKQGKQLRRDVHFKPCRLAEEWARIVKQGRYCPHCGNLLQDEPPPRG